MSRTTPRRDREEFTGWIAGLGTDRGHRIVIGRAHLPLWRGDRRKGRGPAGCNRIPRLSAPGRHIHLHRLPLATSTTAFGISDSGEIAGFYNDAAGATHGFIYASGAFSTVDVAGARATLLTRIKTAGR